MKVKIPDTMPEKFEYAGRCPFGEAVEGLDPDTIAHFQGMRVTRNYRTREPKPWKAGLYTILDSVYRAIFER